jgi:hypothetical protein
MTSPRGRFQGSRGAFRLTSASVKVYYKKRAEILGALALGS